MSYATPQLCIWKCRQTTSLSCHCSAVLLNSFISFILASFSFYGFTSHSPPASFSLPPPCSCSVVGEISRLLNTGLDEETLRVCVQLIEAGVNPEALATVVQELVRESRAFRVRECVSVVGRSQVVLAGSRRQRMYGMVVRVQANTCDVCVFKRL